jgi:WD40 repeat protein
VSEAAQGPFFVVSWVVSCRGCLISLTVWGLETLEGYTNNGAALKWIEKLIAGFLLVGAGHALGVVAVAAHPAGTLAASTSLDSYVRVFDVDTNATVATLETPPSEAWLMQFHPKVGHHLIAFS